MLPHEIAKIDAAIAAGRSVMVKPATTAGKTATATARTPASSPAAAVAARQPATVPGVDYPAHWDTSPVDGNATPEQAARPTTKGKTTPASGAGSAYPAHWKR